MKNTLDITKVACQHYDRSEEVDAAVIRHYIDVVIPNANALKPEEINAITKCKEDLGLDNNQQVWSTYPGTLNDVVEKYQTMNDKMITVKAVAKIDENVEVLLGWIMDFNSNERINSHIKWNGGTMRTSAYAYKTHSSYVASEIPFPLIATRRFNGWQVWKKGHDGNPDS